MESFRTGQPAPSTEMYSFAGHTEDNSSCQPNEEERKIPLVVGENFPPFKFARSVRAIFFQMFDRYFST
jgi:hypothetical protein